MIRFVPIIAGLWVSTSLAAVPHVNFENHPIHALDLSPDGSMLAAAHTADHRVQLFDVSEGQAVFAGHVVVGMDPVSVRFRTDNELWVVNHISDTVSVVDLPSRRTIATLETLDEPFDVVFAGSPERAYVSCSQTNAVQVFNPRNLNAQPVTIDIDAEDPRAMAVSPDGMQVYVAIFESGNRSTVLAGATEQGSFPPNATRLSTGPYGGQNPPPNDGSSFSPPLNPSLPEAPKVAMIVKKDDAGRWMDDSGGNWTPFVSGNSASQSGRSVGWDMPDRDIAVIDTDTRQVTYVSGLMNMGMGLAVNPLSGEPTLIGTDATNEVRFEPNVRGTFVRVMLARVAPQGQPASLTDLNPHLDYMTATIPQSERDRSIGDPRGIAWHTDGSRGYITGMGSNNVIVVDSQGARLDQISGVGEGPTGLALSRDETRLYVWNHFEASLSVIEVESLAEIDRVAVFNPLPDAIREGRAHFYDSQQTSGLGQASCASCHVDGRSDRLAWDLGDPSGTAKSFNQNCMTSRAERCADFHPMKGPMTTQTLQDIIGKEPFHWRGDRDGLEEFNGAFVSLLGDDAELSDREMQEFEDFLATITLPPNPFRKLDNTLSTDVPLDGHFTTGRFAMAGQPLGSGNARAGLSRFRSGIVALVPAFDFAVGDCGGCHAIPTGTFVNGGFFDLLSGSRVGGGVIPEGPNGENHLGVVGVATLSEITMKVPQLRTLYDKVGFDLRGPDSRAGFGFMHDGAVDTLANLVSLEEFDVTSDQDVADIVAFLLSFSGSDLPTTNPAYDAEPPSSQDSHAAVGKQVTASGETTPGMLTDLMALADEAAVDLVAHTGPSGWLYQGNGGFLPDDGGPERSQNALLGSGESITFTAVPKGLGERLALDRDGDGITNRVEITQGSNPADAASSTFSPIQGLWYNPARSGHGIDLQRAGNLLAGTWYTYEDDGSPTWYQAVGPFGDHQWSADLMRFVWNPDGGVDGEIVGEMSFEFADARTAEFCWTLGDRSGCEPFRRFEFSADRPLRNYTGLWFDPMESGYGLSVDTLGNVRVVVVYFYDADRQPRWVIGQGDNSISNTIDMLSFQGFCPDCDTIATASASGGTVGLSFSTAVRGINMDLDVSYPGLPDSLWQRADVDLVPLTDVPVSLEQ